MLFVAHLCALLSFELVTLVIFVVDNTKSKQMLIVMSMFILLILKKWNNIVILRDMLSTMLWINTEVNFFAIVI